MNTIHKLNAGRAVMVMRRLFYLLLCFICEMAWAGFGDTMEVPTIAEYTIPYGWALVSKGYFGPKIYSSLVPTRTFYTIKNLNGAACGDSVEILGDSPIPDGWVITNESISDKTYFTIVYSIKCIIGAPIGQTEEIFYKSPIPFGWVVSGEIRISLHGYNRYRITNISNDPNDKKSSSTPKAGSDGWTRMTYK